MNHVSLAVSRQHRDGHSRDLGRDDGSRRHAEGRVDGVALPAAVGTQRFAEASAADDADHASSVIARDEAECLVAEASARGCASTCAQWPWARRTNPQSLYE